MASKIIILIFSVCASLGAQRLPASEYLHYDGYYTSNVETNDPFFNFAQFELHTQTKKGRAPSLLSKVIFYTDTAITNVDTECVTTFRQLFISRDSLFFETQNCFGESYQFRGHFLGIPSEFEAKDDEPILEGTIVFLKNHKRVRQEVVNFFWSVGC